MSLSNQDSCVLPSKRDATYQDVLDAPPNMVAEIVDGELLTMPRPSPPHLLAHSYLHYWSNLSYGHGSGGGTGKWLILSEPELHLSKHVLVPDIACWRLLRMPMLPTTAFFSISPDWICEVRSDSTRNTDLGPKKMIYAAHGVEFYWLVDSSSRSIEVLSLKDGVWSIVDTASGDAEARLPPFDSIPLVLKCLWEIDSPMPP